MTRIPYANVAVLFTAIAAGTAAGQVFSAAQDAPAQTAGSQADLPEIPRPDLTGTDPQAREQIQTAQAKLEAAQSSSLRTGRAEALGNLGRIYQAYGFESAALACYTNAARLDPQSFRWSYYAGYLGQEYGDTEVAERAYQHALTLKPNDSPALLRLGSLELTLDHPEAAKEYFSRAAAQPEPSAAALTGLGKAALAERQYSLALKYFTQALDREPQASSIHYQLAMAYRGTGDLKHAEEQLQIRGNVEPAVPDPLLGEIDALKQGKFGLLERGNTAMRENHFADALNAYRQMASLDPSDPIAYNYLGLTLARLGKPEEALKQYRHSLELNPANATVYYNIGILLIETGKEAEAIVHFQQALKADPGLTAAHFQLANLFMREKQDAEAGREYGIAASLEPQNGFARLMQAMAAVHAGSYARARTLLEEASTAFPKDPDIANALARLLAAAPDPAVRDPGRALRMVGMLVDRQQGDALEVGITLAMALAAAGHFREAAVYQQAIIKQLEDSRQYDDARRLHSDLIRYQDGKASRTPWTSDDPIFTPVPSTAQLLPDAKMMIGRP